MAGKDHEGQCPRTPEACGVGCARPGSTNHIHVEENEDDKDESIAVRLKQLCLFLIPAWNAVRESGHRIFTVDDFHRISLMNKHIWLTFAGKIHVI